MKKFISVLIVGLGMGTAVAHAHTEEHSFEQEFAHAKLSNEVVIEQCWLRSLPANVPDAGYFELHNNKDNSIELVAARSTAYEEIMLHESYEEDGLLKMRMADAIIIPAKESLSFIPGGYHMMLEEPQQAVQLGESIEVEFLLLDDGSNEHSVVSAQCKINSAKARHYDEDTRQDQ